MRALVLLSLTVLIQAATADYVPAGFVPLPPLPVKTNAPAKLTTQKPKVTPPKPTQPSATKAPAKPTTTKAPIPTTAKPTPAPTQAPTTQRPTTSKPNCGLNINLPSTNCNNGGNSAVQQSLTSLKQQLDQARQQSQAQNQALQGMVTKLQGQQLGYLTKISDLQNEVKNLVTAFNALSGSGPISTRPPLPTSSSSGTGASNPLLQQAVQNVRQDLSTAVSTFNSEIFNLSSQLQSSTQQELKIHQSIEAQIQQQSSDIGRLTQQVKDLERRLNNTNTSNNTSSNNNGATNADIAKLRAQIAKVESEVQQYSQDQQKQFANLTIETTSLSSEVGNHTYLINGLKTTIIIAQNKINKVDSDVTVVHDALANLRKTSIPKMNKIESDIQTLTSEVATAKTSVANIGKSVFNLVIQSGTDEQQLKGLVTQTNNIKTTLQTVQTDLASQKTEIAGIRTGMVNLKNSVPIAELNDMNNVILTIMQNSTNVTQAQLQKLTNAITKITSKLSNLSPPSGPSSG